MDQMDELEGLVFGDLVEGGPVKDVVCSNKWLRFMNRLTRDEGSFSINTEMGKTIKLGLRVSSYMGAIGIMNFIPHPMFKGALENYALVIDPANIKIRPLAQSDMKLRVDMVHDGTDGQTDEWLIELGPQISNEQTHAIIKLT